MIDSVRRALLAAGQDDTIVEFPTGTHSAADAATAIGCSVAQIAKSIVFRSGDDVVLVVASGAHRIDRHKLAAIIGRPVKPADSDWVRTKTGFSVGGVAPVGHAGPVIAVIDKDLLPIASLWAAAGSPMHVFRTTPEQLIAMTGGARGGHQAGVKSPTKRPFAGASVQSETRHWFIALQMNATGSHSAPHRLNSLSGRDTAGPLAAMATLDS